MLKTTDLPTYRPTDLKYVPAAPASRGQLEFKKYKINFKNRPTDQPTPDLRTRRQLAGKLLSQLLPLRGWQRHIDGAGPLPARVPRLHVLETKMSGSVSLKG